MATATVGKNNHDKTEASVSCPTEALFFAAVPPEPLLPRKFGQALAVESSATATAYGDSFQRLSLPKRSGRLRLFRLPGLTRLTRREREVAQLACEGRSNKEIAENACLSLQTVKKHLHSVFRKLQVPSRTRLVALAA
jgi:DNA-binding CsgD family transcriptional regulator